MKCCIQLKLICHTIKSAEQKNIQWRAGLAGNWRARQEERVAVTHILTKKKTDFPEKFLSMKNLGNSSEDPVSGMNFRHSVIRYCPSKGPQPPISFFPLFYSPFLLISPFLVQDCIDF